MKIFLRIVSIIIEIIVAVAIFMMIVQKTPLFDRAIPGRSDTSWSSISTIQDKNITSTSDINSEKLSELLAYENNAEIITDQPVYSGESCTSPWGTSISDNNSIIAYRSQRSDSNNECYSEIRTCQNGKLWGNFVYKTCDYIIDGQLIKNNGTREDIVAGASNSTQKIIDLSKFYNKVQTTPKEYIQPKPYKDKASLSINQIKWLKMDNSKKPIIQQDLTDTLDQTIPEDDNTNNKKSCRTPWGKRIDHGSFVYAYNQSYNTIWQQCMSQKRSCDDGILWWTYRYESCTFNTNNHTEQAIIYSQPTTLYNGTLSPYSPYVRPIGESIRDTLLRSHRSSNTSMIGQNYIEVSNCLTPWGSTIANGWRITAYRLPTSTSNSLCDSETRVCRSWVLWWRYTYPSCTTTNYISSSSHETWIEKNIKSIGKDADNVRGWIKWWFK